MKRTIKFEGEAAQQADLLLTKEWLVTNGLSGYASGTIGGVATRRYHSLLIAALPAPLGRVNMFNHLSEMIQLPDGNLIQLGSDEPSENILNIPGAGYLIEFSLEWGMPVWRYNISGTTIEKRIVLPYMQNTVHVNYRIVDGHGPIRLELRPSFHFRPHEAPVNYKYVENYKLQALKDRYEIIVDDDAIPSLKLKLFNREGALTIDGGLKREFYYRTEAERGYESGGSLYNPGYFRAILVKGQDATLAASTENWETILALSPEDALKSELERRKRLIAMAGKYSSHGIEAELVLAADQFIMTPAGRVEDAARARASGDEVRSIIAGYHWFTDWGRDTMISLEGLTIATGRESEARWILRTFAHYIKDGLIPNMFPEGEKQGLYHTADATLWFFQALNQYIEASDDKVTLNLLLPKLVDVVEHHLKGTRFGIAVDEKDGLLKQGEEGYQLTWMDAKVDGWVVTPRRGKAVEINALWYNALMLLSNWLKDNSINGEESSYEKYFRHAEKAKESFNKKFWNDQLNYCFDIVEGENGNDDALRPNQIFAISLKHPILNENRWKPVIEITKEKLLTPVGLRSLAPGHPDYKPKYFGNLRARDAAYHQGTVWGWLIGHFIDAYLKVFPNDLDSAQHFIEGFNDHYDEACIGSISEIFDAEEPYTPRGCIAQAWSVAEVLRIRTKLAKLKEENREISLNKTF